MRAQQWSLCGRRSSIPDVHVQGGYGRAVRRSSWAAGTGGEKIRTAVIDHGNPGMMHGSARGWVTACANPSEGVLGGTIAPPPPTEPTFESLSSTLLKTSTHLQTIHSSLPARSALIIFTLNGRNATFEASIQKGLSVGQLGERKRWTAADDGFGRGGGAGEGMKASGSTLDHDEKRARLRLIQFIGGISIVGFPLSFVFLHLLLALLPSALLPMDEAVLADPKGRWRERKIIALESWTHANPSEKTALISYFNALFQDARNYCTKPEISSSTAVALQSNR
ncbi:hypothetical protein BDP27DRAFT_1364856 [Rhodocollybia butyracea]|uniref:Uncharacterized protein n=1 Tax=Rhodocollybia butyracea TaxID=206335 RepID=A0A9P5U621_9AGAR|nr:hypothetical protein BDP27DRAFT_1364856 [Rhodocollybia butyracea]